MDDLTAYLKERWRALATGGALFSRPWTDLDPDTARARLARHGLHADLEGLDVLCLASGGGQQSVAAALLGARVVSLDLSREQLDLDRATAASLGLTVRTVEADMRAIPLPAISFDVVLQPFSINFVPGVRTVFEEAARVLRPGGLYCFGCRNPFASDVGTRDWTGDGYRLRRPYAKDTPFALEDEDWVGASGQVPAPREYLHTLGTLLNVPLALGFRLAGFVESAEPGDASAEPGSWQHLQSVLPILIGFVWRLDTS